MSGERSGTHTEKHLLKKWAERNGIYIANRFQGQRLINAESLKLFFGKENDERKQFVLNENKPPKLNKK